ncbi:ATP-dependent DNA helicase PIF1-like [Fagus crenata]
MCIKAQTVYPLKYDLRQIMMRSNNMLMQDGYVLQRHFGRYSVSQCIEYTLASSVYKFIYLIPTREFPEHYWWISRSKTWRRRESNKKWAGVRELWNEFYTYMVEDYPSSSEATDVVRTNLLLNDLKSVIVTTWETHH